MYFLDKAQRDITRPKASDVYLLSIELMDAANSFMTPR